MKNEFENKNILISGNGSWAQELIKQISLFKPKSITSFSRNEFKIVELSRKLNNPLLKIVIGDIRDKKRMYELTKNKDIVIHTAALKHLPICEDFMNEAVSTNIYGTQNLLRQAEINNVKKFILTGTDKCCNPNNLYGATKAVCERLVIGHKGKMKTVTIRAGNVIGSAGSVIPFFIEKAKNKESLPITDYKMTRYLMTLSDAIALVLKASKDCIGGEIFVTKMPAAKVLDVAKVIWEKYNCTALDEGWEIYPEIGIRPGEKIDEMLVSEHEALYTVEDDNFRIILPMDGSLDSDYKNFKKMKEKQYTSNDKLMNEEEIKKMLIGSGFLK